MKRSFLASPDLGDVPVKVVETKRFTIDSPTLHINSVDDRPSFVKLRIEGLGESIVLLAELVDVVERLRAYDARKVKR